jgi:prepilin-type processing-associated H-X9-DG protein
VVNPQTGNTAQGGAFYALLPYYEQNTVFQTYNQDIPNAGYLGAQYIPLTIHCCPSDGTQKYGISTLDGKSATGNYSCNLALFGAAGTFNQLGVSSPYQIGTIPDGSSNTIGLMENSASFPGYPAIDPQTGTYENLMLWSWPAYPNSVGCYWPNPDELPGQKNYTGTYPLPQFNITPMQANPNLAQSYHPGHMNLAMMDGSVHVISDSITQTTWTYALQPDDGQPLGSDW